MVEPVRARTRPGKTESRFRFDLIRFLARAAAYRTHRLVVGYLAGCPLGGAIAGIVEYGWEPRVVGVGLLAGLLGGAVLAVMLCGLLPLWDDHRRELRRLRR